MLTATGIYFDANFQAQTFGEDGREATVKRLVISAR